MATNEIHLKNLTQIRFFVTGSFSPVDPATNWTQGTPTDVVLTLSGVVDDAGRQSTKVSLGATRGMRCKLFGCVDFTLESPVSGSTVEYYWAPSTSATTANGNVAGNSGIDGDAPAGALGSITLDEFLDMCIYIGPLVVHDGAVVQNGYVGEFVAPTQWGQLVVVNRSGDVFEADDVEMHQIIEVETPDIQAAA